jgi:hypothetical protein
MDSPVTGSGGQVSEGIEYQEGDECCHQSCEPGLQNGYEFIWNEATALTDQDHNRDVNSINLEVATENLPSGPGVFKAIAVDLEVLPEVTTQIGFCPGIIKAEAEGHQSEVFQEESNKCGASSMVKNADSGNRYGSGRRGGSFGRTGA